MSASPTSKLPKRYPPWYNLSLTQLPLPGLVSIFHRLSGILLFVLLVWLLYLLDRSLASPEGFAELKVITGHWFARLVLLGVLWAYLHHFCAGIRYLLLDMHKGIDLPQARMTSSLVFGVSLVLTLVLGWVILW